MKLFNINKNHKIENLFSKNFETEKEIQNLVEKNLDTLFKLQFITSELSIKSFRIDTLAFDEENKSFVIIEYKKDRSFTIMDQGFTYLSLMLNNKSDFILEYNENCSKNLKRDDIDWSQSKVIFISQNFTDFQKQSINFKDALFELWEIKKYENGLLVLIPYKSTSNESISTISKDTNDVVSKIAKEIKIYTEEYHLEFVFDNVKELYFTLKERILNFGNDIEIVYRKFYIAFVRKTNFVDIEVQQKQIKVSINMIKGELDDTRKLAKDVSTIGHLGNGDYQININSEDDLDYIIFLIKQSYKNQE